MVRVASLAGKAIIDRRGGANDICFVTNVVNNKIYCTCARSNEKLIQVFARSLVGSLKDNNVLGSIPTPWGP